MFLQTDGHLLHAVELGAGPAFVAHGGWVGSWELWEDAITLMHARWRCISYDHRGSGASTFPPSSIDASSLVDDLFRVLDHFQVEKCVLAGESLGAMTCLLAAIRDPARFSGLVLVDGVPFGDQKRQQALVDGSRTDYAQTVAAFVEACVPEPDSDHIRRWGRQILMRADPEAAARVLEASYETTPPDLQAVLVPTLVIHGERDAIVPLELARLVAGAVPQAELVVLPGAGHVPTLTRPADVVKAIEDWAGRVGAVPAIASRSAGISAPNRDSR